MPGIDVLAALATISDETAENLLHDLVAIPSPSFEEGEAAHFLVDWMAVYGYDEAYVDAAGNAVGIIGQGERDIVLLSHMDTFSGNPPVRREGRLLYGRGSVDAKGSLCTFAVAAARAALPHNLRLIVIGAVEEESASSKGARYAASQFDPEACFIGEPSHWDRITLGYMGHLLIDWHWEGPLAHSAGPVPSAAEHAIAYWDRVRDYAEAFNQARETLFSRLHVSLRGINTWQEDVNGVAEMTVGFRLPPGITTEQVFADLQPDDGASVQPYSAIEAYVTERNNMLSRAMRGAIRANGGQPRFVHKTGTADMNVVGPIWNCPIVAYGPGDSELDHTPTEHIDLDEYLRAIRVLTDAIERL